jgi:hypothetical protein
LQKHEQHFYVQCWLEIWPSCIPIWWQPMVRWPLNGKVLLLCHRI